MTRYAIINQGIKSLNIEEEHPYVYQSDTTAGIVHWIKDNGADDENYCIEIFEVDSEGEFFSGSDFDSISNFTKRRVLMIRRMTGLSQAAFAAKYRIPKRSIESWESLSETAGREAPEYVLDLLERAVRVDLKEEKDMKVDEIIESGHYNAAVELMDDELREAVHNDLAPCTDKEFLAEYMKRHLEKYGEEFTI